MPITVPPSDVAASLAGGNHIGYLVIGEDPSPAWNIAVAAEGDLPGVLAIRAATRADVAAYVVQPTVAAVILGWDGTVQHTLSQAEAEDQDTVYNMLTHYLNQQ